MRAALVLLVEQVADGRLGQVLAAHHAVHVGAVERLELDQRLGQRLDAVLVALQELAGLIVERVDQLLKSIGHASVFGRKQILHALRIAVVRRLECVFVETRGAVLTDLDPHLGE